MFATMMISGWVTLLLLAAVTLVGGFCVFNLVSDDTEERENRRYEDKEIREKFYSQVRSLEAVLHELSSRVTKLEPPPYDQAVETKLCPGCNEEKELPADDYICSQCREQENIAA